MLRVLIRFGHSSGNRVAGVVRPDGTQIGTVPFPDGAWVAVVVTDQAHAYVLWTFEENPEHLACGILDENAEVELLDLLLPEGIELKLEGGEWPRKRRSRRPGSGPSATRPSPRASWESPAGRGTTSYRNTA